MSQKVSPLLFNNYIYNNSKWFTKINEKYALNEDLQIRELINIIFKNNINNQYLFIDKIIIYKYYKKMKIYIYFFCNFNYLKCNLILKKFQNKNYITISYLYYKYLEILKIKQIEILKILRTLLHRDINILLYLKNINYNYNNILNLTNIININTKNNTFDYYQKIYKTYKYCLQSSIKLQNKTIFKDFNKKDNKKRFINMKNSKIKNFNVFKSIKKFETLKYFKTIRFILYFLCYNDKSLIKLNASNLINILFYELTSLDNTSKTYNFLFYNLFNIIREQLVYYFKDNNCKIKGIRIQVKGRYFLTKRKRIFIFNFGNLNLNKISCNKDYHSLNLIKSTGSSSIKIWINYKN